jgi:ATP-dependent helicase/nuclease subunit B
MSSLKKHFLSPNRQSIEDLAKHIWEITQNEQVSPIVVFSTSGPAYGLRAALEKTRPQGLAPHLVFLPRVLGLTQWLRETPDLIYQEPVKSDLARWMDVYQTLSSRPQLRSLLTDASEASKWALSKNLIDACDLISEASLGIEGVDPEKALADAIDTVYQGASRVAVDVETKILLTFWENLATVRDPVARQRQSLGWRAASAKKIAQPPLVYIETAKGSPGFERSFESFIEAYASNSAVHHFVMDYNKVGLWPECLEDSSRQQATLNQDQFLQNLDKSDRQIIKASSFEDAAWAGAHEIQTFLKIGRCHIALIAQDRLVARRIRALLARLGSGVSIHDETGWKLSTTRAASALMSWIDVIKQPYLGPSAIVLLEFLKNPYINWAKWNLKDEDMPRLIQSLEQRFIQSDAQGGWSGMLLALDRHSDGFSFDAAQSIFHRLRAISQKWQKKPQACHSWLEHLLTDLDELGMTGLLNEDLAGQQLIAALDPMRSVQGDPLRLNEWLSLLASMVEDASYIEVSPRGNASITILPLSATRLRHFDAWVMVGCDDSQLPSLSESPMFLSASLKKIIGCKTIEAEFSQQAMDLSQLMTTHNDWRMIWQSKGSAGEPRQASPWLQRLYMSSPKLLHQSPTLEPVSFVEKKVRAPMPSLASDFEKPHRISPSAYKALRECPYRYYATRLLGLREQAQLDAEVDLSLVGQTLHAALKSFYQGLRTNPYQGDTSKKKDYLENLLKNISLRHFQPLLEADGRWLAAWVQWGLQIPGWIEWQLKRESEGWIFYDGEISVEFNLETRFGPLQVFGQLDRIDIHPKDGVAVIDYKYSTEASIKKKQKNIEDDPQLVIYAKALDGQQLVNGATVQQASWVSIKEPDVDLAVDDLETRMAELPAQIIADIERVWGGEVLKASGPDSVCQYCQVRGLCRKGMWA